jgi:hypothetical protein
MFYEGVSCFGSRALEPIFSKYLIFKVIANSKINAQTELFQLVTSLYQEYKELFQLVTSLYLLPNQYFALCGKD